MFFAKTLLILAAVSTTAFGSALVAPVLGVSGPGTITDVQKPTPDRLCGKTPFTAIDTSKTAPLRDDKFTVIATSFSAGPDGSTQFTAQVDTTGKGTSFQPARVSQNGNPNPGSTGNTQITVQVPAGTTCTGGKTRNLCLVSFRSSAGFGNCVVVSSSAAGTAAKAGAATAETTKNNRHHARDFLGSLEEKREYVKHMSPRVVRERV
ncbi:hypothetical protein BDV93DRAFT_544880 [Ceratobasidium sp. AG-I]|nr:hypothetical protein BDV93DRAFT_544880 [Ceratobasidium sp. AG-I]